MEEKKKKINPGIIVTIVVISIFIISIIKIAFAFGLVLFIPLSAKEEVYRDIEKYNNYIGEKADKNFRNKWGMSEEIFPKTIKDYYDVEDFKFVYYDPWDANYLAFLEIEIEDDYYYEKELDRLEKIGIDSYKGYYGVTGFSKYELLAMTADSYQGFVYALKGKDNRIIYVEMIFCNYFMDIDYNKYIPKKYLPDGFDATMDNPYSKQKDKEQGVGNLF